ncbi:MAG: STAS domain-containing protein [Chitinivibrionales bacterium]|nr:STAS domain-containing protein [Chitinivibrionales bacterium]
MKINIYTCGKYQVLKFVEDLKVVSELSELQFLIEGYLKQGKKNIAVSFTDSSYIYSGAIAVLIACYKIVKNQGGDLCILEPNPDILSILTFLNINRLIAIYESEFALPDYVPAPAPMTA